MAQTNIQRRAQTFPRARMAKQHAGAARLWAFRSRPVVLGQQRADFSTVTYAPTARVNPNPFVLPSLAGVPASRVLSNGDTQTLRLEALVLRMLELDLIPALNPHAGEPVIDWLKRAWKTGIEKRFRNLSGEDTTGSTILQFDIGHNDSGQPVFVLDCAQSWWINLRAAHERFAPIHEHALASIVAHINGNTAPLWTAAFAIEHLECMAGGEEDWPREEIDRVRAEIAEEESIPLEAITTDMALTNMTGMTMFPSTVKESIPAAYHNLEPHLSLAALKRLAKCSTDSEFGECVRLAEIAVNANRANRPDHMDLAELRSAHDGDYPMVGVCGYTTGTVCLVRETFEEAAQMSAQESGWRPLWIAPVSLEGVDYLHRFMEHGLPGLLAALKFLDVIELIDFNASSDKAQP